MKKIFYLILLVIFCAIVFMPLAESEGLLRLPFLFTGARPSTLPLPQPWQGELTHVTLHPVSLAGEGAAQPGLQSGGYYIVRHGDTLGSIASESGVRIDDLLAANPELGDPDRIRVGQALALPGSSGFPPAGLPETGGGETAPAASPPPGGSIAVHAEGLPATVSARVGIGLSSTGYLPAGRAFTDETGVLSAVVAIPAEAQPGESAFILITVEDNPLLQAKSGRFQIGE